MELHSLQKAVTKGKRRVGQGHGSGRVKTSGRGTKGQKARGSIALTFEGGALPLIKRLPFVRGKGKNNSIHSESIAINVGKLNTLPQNSEVTLESLVKANIIRKREGIVRGVKILGDGDLTVALTVKVPVSKSAEEKILKAGGKIEITTI